MDTIAESDSKPAGMPRCEKKDLLTKIAPVVGPRGFQRTGPQGFDTKKDFSILVLTDGVSHDSNGAIIATDYMPYGGTSTTLTFALPKPSDIAAIQVFSLWGDVRAYHNYDVDYSSGYSGEFKLLARNVQVGRPGEKLPFIPGEAIRSMTRIRSDDSEPIARNVSQIRFTFWAPGYSSKQTNFVTTRNDGRWGSALTEIDVIAQPPHDPSIDLRQEPR